jgi:predicted NBD/HSP70 family sugar kinase
LLDINPSSRYAIGLNISRSGCSAGIINIKGELILKREIDIKNVSSPVKAIKNIANELEKLIEDSKIQKDKFLGIGVSAPGPLAAYSGRILNPPNFSMWHDFDLVDELKRYFPFSVHIENNAAALTLAEKNYGKCSEFKNFMLLVVDSGIGAGIVINDQLYRGAGGFGSEVGHSTIDIYGEPCDCGNRGCLECYASIPAILKYARLQDPGILSWAEIVDRAEARDKTCLEIIDKEAHYLAAGIVNIINLLENEAVFLTGFINYKPNLLLNRLNSIIRGTMMTRDIHKVLVSESSIISDSDVISAAAIEFDKFFSS